MRHYTTLIPLLCAAVTFMAHGTTFSGVRVDSVTYSSALVAWTTSSPTPSLVKYGSGGVLSRANADQFQRLLLTHQYFISGLNPNSTYIFQVCASSSDCSGTFSFSTAAKTLSAAPSLPQQRTNGALLPRPGPPRVDGTTFVIDANCSNLQAALNAAARADGALTHQILIPRTADCATPSRKSTGNGNGHSFEFPAKSGQNRDGSGEIIIRTDASDLLLPPIGTRVSPSYRLQMPILRNTTWGVRELYSPISYLTCTVGQLWWQFNQPGWSLKQCVDPNANSYSLVQRVDFSGAPPKTCNASQWYFKTDEPDNVNGIYWCAPNRRLYNMSLGRIAHFTFAPNAHHYRFIGLQFDVVPMGSRNWAKTAVYTDGSYYVGHFNIPDSAHHISFDRCYFSGSDYPERLQNVLYSASSYLSITDSMIENVSFWLPSMEAGDLESTALQLTGGSFIRVDNNSIESAGITLFASDDSPLSMTTNVEITRNKVSRPARYRLGSPENSLLPPQAHQSRHLLELKRGVRWLVDGNEFDGNFATVNQAHFISLSPRPGGMSWERQIGMSDITISNNSFRNGPNGIYLIGHHDGADGQMPITSRVAIVNNVLTGIDGSLSARGTPGRYGHCLTMLYGLEDITINNNLCINQNGYWPALLWEQYGPSAGLSFNKNIMTVKTGDYYGGLINPGNARGTASLQAGFPGGWQFANNALINLSADDPKTYPQSTCWYRSDNEVGWTNPSAGDFRLLPTSSLITGGSCSYDGSTVLAPNSGVGPSMEGIWRAQGAIRSVSVRAGYTDLSVTSARLAGQPGCRLEVSAYANFAGSRDSSSGATTSDQLVTLSISGLLSGKEYYWRLACGTIAEGKTRTLGGLAVFRP
jgi:hypothetical protein